MQCGPRGSREARPDLPRCRHTSLSLSPPLLKVLEIYVKCGGAKTVLQNQTRVEAARPPAHRPPVSLAGQRAAAVGGGLTLRYTAIYHTYMMAVVC